MQSWTTELPQNSVTSLIQTRRGYIWAGTYSGIAQFDGLHFTVFDASNTNGLVNSRVTSLFEDSQGNIWVGHESGELSKYCQGNFSPVTLKPGWSHGTINGIREDEFGDIWAVNTIGEAVRVRDGLLVKPLPEMTQDPVVMPQLTGDGHSRLILVRNGVVAKVTPTGDLKETFGETNSYNYYVRAAPARDGGLWVAEEIRVRKWKDERWQTALQPVPWSKNGFVTTMLESSTGRLLVGTLEEGLFIYDKAFGWLSLNRTNGLPQNWVRSLVEDHEQNLWVGTSGGLVLLRPRQVVMHSPSDDWEGWPVRAIAPAHDGSVWAATEGAGVYRMMGNEWTHFGSSSGLSNLFVWTVMEDSQKRLWAGTWGGGLFLWETNRFVRQFDLAERGEPVTALAESPPGTLWIGSAVGLLRLVNNTLERFAPMGGALAGDVRALEPGLNGDLWVGTQGQGLGHLINGKCQTLRSADGLPGECVLSLHQDADGTLWIGTLDRGICRLRNGRFDSITAAQGLPNNVIGHIANDGFGNLWFNSQKGLFRVSKSELNLCADGQSKFVRPLVFGEPEGMSKGAGSSGFTPSGFRTEDGKLWFPTVHGIAVVNPKAVRQNDARPAVWVEQVLVDGQQADNGWPGSLEGEGVNRVVRLKPGLRQLDMLYTGISLTSPERVQFRYRMEGLQGLYPEWTDAGTRRQVTYSFLPPGHYTFRVSACNSDGPWNAVGDAVEVIMLPHVWQTWWFKTTLVIAGVALVGGVVSVESRRRHRRKLERIARERELERERARIAQDIHDDLGASLTRIGMLSQSAVGDLGDPGRATSDLNQIYDTARELTRAMDEIVWAVNPRHDTLESLANYIARFAHDFLSAAHIRCRIDAPVELPERNVRSEIRHNLFLAFKESLNNAVKHSGASEVRVSMQLAPSGFKVIVTDYGRGFSPNHSNPSPLENRVVSGYGITGMRSRLEQIGGEVVIDSTPGEGTRVELFAPLVDVGQLNDAGMPH